MEMTRIPSISSLNAQQQAYLYLQDQIVSGVLVDGTRIKPEFAAQILGISRMPVREAIRQLDAEGYVTIRPNRGAIVKSRSPADVFELYEMRSVLEGLAIRIGTKNATPEMLEDIEVGIERLNRMRSDHLAWIDRHNSLHDQFCAMSGREQLRAECRRLRLSLTPYVRLFLRSNPTPESSGHEHMLILDAVRSGDSERAEGVMRDHIMANAHGIAACLRAPSRSEASRQPAANSRPAKEAMLDG